MLRLALIAAIRAYQRHLSPRKGYACAYRLVHGGSGCSGVGLRLVRRFGALAGLALLRQRLRLCQQTHRLHSRQWAGRHRPAAYQRGDCDPGCMGCGIEDACSLGCDLPLPQRAEKWMEENKLLTTCIALLVAMLAYGIYVLWPT